MPYKDPEKRKAVQRASQQKRRRANGAAEIRRAVAEADVPKVLPDAPDEDELIRILGVQARLGSVQAAKLLLDRIEKRKRDVDSSDPVAELIQLGDRRPA